MANEWMRQDDASPEEALDTWNAMEAEFKINRATAQEPRTMAQEPRIGLQGGQLVQPGVGRQGYSGRPSKHGSNFYYKKSTNEWIVYSRKAGDRSDKKYVHPFKKKSDALKFLKEGEKRQLVAFEKTRKIRTKEVNKAYNNINSWTKKWLNKNMPEYTAKEISTFEKDFAEAWAKELKTNSSSYPTEGIKGIRFDFSTKTNLPWARELKLSGLTSPVDKTSDTFFKKVFYKEKLKNPEFNKQVKSYLEWVVADKKLKTTKLKYKGLETPGSMAGRLKHLETAKINKFDEDVIHLINEMQRGDPSGVYPSLKEQFPGLLKKYTYKVSYGATQWKENLRIVAKNAGLDPDLLYKQMKNENAKVAKILGISVDKVPNELRYAMDHVAGLAEAANYTGANKAAFSRKTLNTFMARTVEQNKKLGRETLSIPRSKLVRKFNKVKTLDAKATIVEDINKLVEKHIPGELKYKVTQSGNLDFKALAPQKTFKSRVSAYQNIPEVNKFLNTFSKTFQTDLSPQSIVLMGKKHNCLKKDEGGSIMRCLQTKFKADPEKFLQRSATLAKGNPNLLKWFKTGKNIARGTGVFALWEAALAPVLAGWMATEGESWDRMKHDISWGPLWEAIGVSPDYVPGISTKEEFMEAAGGNEAAYAAKRLTEINEQELPSLFQQRDDVINKMGHVPGQGFQLPEIEEDIKEKQEELQDVWNKTGFMEGPAASYLNKAKAVEAFTASDAAAAKIVADKKARLELYKKYKIVGSEEPWNYGERYRRADGGLTRTVAPDSEGIMSLKKKR